MAHSSFTDRWSIKAKHELCRIGKDAILCAVKQSRHLQISVSVCEPELQEHGACFVTLLKNGELRGCIGSLEAQRPLAQDLVDNAYAACLRDPRFLPVQEGELCQMSAEVSVLSPLTPITVSSQQELVARLRPFVDGLVIDDGRRRATFLPSVWEQLPDATRFLENLKAKAGMEKGYWSRDIKCYLYETQKLDIGRLDQV